MINLKFINLIKNEDGAAMTEYALLIGLSAVGILVSLLLFRGCGLINLFNRATNSLNNAK